MDTEQTNGLEWISEVTLDLSKLVIKIDNKEELIKGLDFFESQGFTYLDYCTRKMLICEYNYDEYIFINRENGKIDMVHGYRYFIQKSEINNGWVFTDIKELSM